MRAAQSTGSNTLLIDQLAICLLTHVAEVYGGPGCAEERTSGRLAPWQERRAKEIMSARLASELTISQLASECRLTASHFARAFRRSTGVAPQRYLMQLRVDEAKRHLAAAHLPLSDIALICGFGDQSHLTRVFKQLVGMPPGAWRGGSSRPPTSPACPPDPRATGVSRQPPGPNSVQATIAGLGPTRSPWATRSGAPWTMV